MQVWNKANVGSPSGVSTHHPSGDVKKISTYTSTLLSTNWSGSTPGTHWRVVWSGTTSGHGVTEGGSSGSPIWDADGYHVGQLTGGGSFCTATSQPDAYGKMSYNWDSNSKPYWWSFKDLVGSYEFYDWRYFWWYLCTLYQ